MNNRKKNEFRIFLNHLSVSILSKLELKQELHDIINQADDKLVKSFYEKTKTYVSQMRKDKMIA